MQASLSFFRFASVNILIASFSFLTNTPGKFKPIPVDRLDQKRGYCFVFLKDAVVQEDKDNAEQFVEAISGM